MYTILFCGERGLSQLPVLSFRWTSARTMGSHPNFLHVIAERGGLSQLPVLSFRWTSARTMSSHPNFLHVIAEIWSNYPKHSKNLTPCNGWIYFVIYSLCITEGCKRFSQTGWTWTTSKELVWNINYYYFYTNSKNIYERFNENRSYKSNT